MNMTSGLVQSRLVLLISMVACQKIQQSDNGEILFKMWPSPLSVFIWSQWWGRGFLVLRPVEKWTGAFLVANWSLTHLTQCIQCSAEITVCTVQCSAEITVSHPSQDIIQLSGWYTVHARNGKYAFFHRWTTKENLSSAPILRSLRDNGEMRDDSSHADNRDRKMRRQN